MFLLHSCVTFSASEGSSGRLPIIYEEDSVAMGAWVNLHLVQEMLDEKFSVPNDGKFYWATDEAPRSFDYEEFAEFHEEYQERAGVLFDRKRLREYVERCIDQRKEQCDVERQKIVEHRRKAGDPAVSLYDQVLQVSGVKKFELLMPAMHAQLKQQRKKLHGLKKEEQEIYENAHALFETAYPHEKVPDCESGLVDRLQARKVELMEKEYKEIEEILADLQSCLDDQKFFVSKIEAYEQRLIELEDTQKWFEADLAYQQQLAAEEEQRKLEEMDDAAVEVQRVFRGFSGRLQSEKIKRLRVEQQQEKKKVTAVMRIQSLFRNYREQQRQIELRQREEEAARQKEATKANKRNRRKAKKKKEQEEMLLLEEVAAVVKNSIDEGEVVVAAPEKNEEAEFLQAKMKQHAFLRKRGLQGFKLQQEMKLWEREYKKSKAPQELALRVLSKSGKYTFITKDTVSKVAHTILFKLGAMPVDLSLKDIQIVDDALRFLRAPQTALLVGGLENLPAIQTLRTILISRILHLRSLVAEEDQGALEADRAFRNADIASAKQALHEQIIAASKDQERLAALRPLQERIKQLQDEAKELEIRCQRFRSLDSFETLQTIIGDPFGLLDSAKDSEKEARQC